MASFTQILLAAQAPAASGGITFDAVSSSPAGSGSTKTVTHTTGTLTSGYMIIACFNFTNAVTSITYNGSATGISQIATDSSRLEIWGLKAPTSGTHDVVVTWAGSNDCAVGVMTFSGVNQTTPSGTGADATGSSTAPSVTVSSATGELVVGLLMNNFNATMTAGSGVTDKWNQGASGSFATAAGGYKLGAASTVFAWTLGSSQAWEILAVPLKP